MITHHPEPDMLLAYSAGHTPEAVSLIAATHLCLCSRCRDVVRTCETIGGVVLQDLPPTPVSMRVFDTLGLGSTPAEPLLTEGSERDGLDEATPEPLRRYLDKPLDQVRWIPMAPGLAYRPLIADRCGARLVRSRPGHGIGMHTHRGLEYSLVLAGGYTDSAGTYERGDFQHADRRLLHGPVADRGPDCITLVVTDAPLTFSNPVASLIARMIGS